MGNFFRNLFTGKDNKTWSLGRVAWAISLFTFLFVTVWKVTHGATFTLQDFGIGLGAVFAAGPIANGLQAKLADDTGA